MKLILLSLTLSLTMHAREFTLTAYCSCKKCCGKWSLYGKTASGTVPKQGRTCAAPRSIPFGTKLSIPGVGVRIVEDRLAKKYDSRIDIYFSSHSAALNFGKRKVTIP